MNAIKTQLSRDTEQILHPESYFLKKAMKLLAIAILLSSGLKYSDSNTRHQLATTQRIVWHTINEFYMSQFGKCGESTKAHCIKVDGKVLQIVNNKGTVILS